MYIHTAQKMVILYSSFMKDTLEIKSQFVRLTLALLKCNIAIKNSYLLLTLICNSINWPVLPIFVTTNIVTWYLFHF